MRIPSVAYSTLSALASSFPGEFVVFNSPAGSGVYTAISDGTNWIPQGFVYVGTWASRPAANASMPARSKALFTDIGVRPSEFVTDGTNWMPVSGEVLLRAVTNSPTLTNAPGTTETAVDQFTIPAGLWVQGLRLKIILALEKLGTTSVDVQARLRFGTTGGADSICATYTMAGTTNTLGRWDLFERASSTTITKLGAGAASSLVSLSGSSTGGRPTTNTVGNLDSVANFFTITGGWGAAPSAGFQMVINGLYVSLVG